jgi:hypothetical protein
MQKALVIHRSPPGSLQGSIPNVTSLGVDRLSHITDRAKDSPIEGFKIWH